MDKKELRKKQKALLSTLERHIHEHKSFLIASRLFDTEEWKSARTVAVTVSNFPEVDTWQIIRKGWEEGKRIAVPKCRPKEKQLDFYYLTSFADLEKVFYGLLEPSPEKNKPAHPRDIDVVIVPGLAFMATGYRLGFGGGYYDRFLETFQGRTVSLAFQEQLAENIPVEYFDIPVEKIVSEDSVMKCE
ncbi:5-formyltetrahydrofolate cyclo-ligase [Bacillus salacetis]|uniref:5-formyltetrahydrofolate cyclo-ligase n=1 Tax=Bacillus salacetis TaxID=2315464 RepID=A0A3A1QTK7_9BACI|nr:5-formyltetrahydrofolate cyclo-ligase [Bacillus salacetis]RIW31056.1 5-formyltetrahydrofolate cyclo-ligase [Bacillus salacetis]